MSPPSPADHPIEASRAVYGISVAAELVGSAPQNLRLYEANGRGPNASSQPNDAASVPVGNIEGTYI